MGVRKAEEARDLRWVNFKAPRLVGMGGGAVGGRDREGVS